MDRGDALCAGTGIFPTALRESCGNPARIFARTGFVWSLICWSPKQLRVVVRKIGQRHHRVSIESEKCTELFGKRLLLLEICVIECYLQVTEGTWLDLGRIKMLLRAARHRLRAYSPPQAAFLTGDGVIHYSTPHHLVNSYFRPGSKF